MESEINILLVEDHIPDQKLTQRAFQKGKLKIKLHIVNDGVECMQFLLKQENYEKAVTPHLILLDLNMPRKDGREVLMEMKAHPELKQIPIIILTTSSDDKDIQDVYHLYGNAYIVKPVSFLKFAEAIQSIEDFWLGVTALPKSK